MLLEVFINGRDTGKIAEFVQRDDTLLLQPADLEPLGLRGPKSGDNSGALIPLTALSRIAIPRGCRRAVSFHHRAQQLTLALAARFRYDWPPASID